MDRNRQRQCTRKQRYYGRWGAFLAQQSAERRTGEAHDIYRCPWCGHWHIGHKRK